MSIPAPTGPSPADSTPSRDITYVDRLPDGDRDEVFEPDGTPRPGYDGVLAALADAGSEEIIRRTVDRDVELRRRDVTFRVAGEDEAHVMPFDVVPRLIGEAEWRGIAAGLEQRTLALELFLRDVYGERHVLRDGIVPTWVIDNAPGLRPEGRAVAVGAVRAVLAGVDLVRDGMGDWHVLEDNLRVPSGLAYASTARELAAGSPSLVPRPDGILSPDGVAASLTRALRHAAGPSADAGGDPHVAILTEGPHNSAYFEHRTLADAMGVPLVVATDLSVEGHEVWSTGPHGRHRVDVLYRRLDEQDLAKTAIAESLFAAARQGGVTIANAAGNGVADDKTLYAFVPRLIEYYLGERPLLPQVGTYLCAIPEQLEHVLERLDELVVKPVDGYGGIGVVVGPDSDRAEIEQVRGEIRAHPDAWIAQEVVALSVHPTFTPDGFEPRAVDLRAFVVVDGATASPTATTLSAALTRVAPAGSLVVNSSQGGGIKDTWIGATP